MYQVVHQKLHYLEKLQLTKVFFTIDHHEEVRNQKRKTNINTIP
jgi:hypothetical protein